MAKTLLEQETIAAQGQANDVLGVTPHPHAQHSYCHLATITAQVTPGGMVRLPGGRRVVLARLLSWAEVRWPGGKK